MQSGAHSSLHLNCYHQRVFAKFNLFILYSLPYKRIVWFYEKADAELMGKAINEFDWIRALSNFSIGEKNYFTKTFLNLIHNFISEERTICDHRDRP